jgi:DNA-binding transcriptional LysR family regulator
VLDVNTRQLRYFVAVAEELNFTRAAARVYIAQQALSLQIRKLEEQLGVRLFERNTRHVELSAAGAALLPEARRILGNWDHAQDLLADVREESVTLRLGFVAGAAVELTGPIIDEFTRSHPRVTLLQRAFHWDDPSAGLTRSLSDVAFVRPPLEGEGLEFHELMVEPRVAVFRVDHPLAGRESVSARELLDLPIITVPSPDPLFNDFWLLTEERGGPPERIAAVAMTLDEELMAVASGLGFQVTAASAARYAPRRGICFVPIRDVAGSALSVARRADDRHPLSADFIACALAVRDRETVLVDAMRAGTVVE